MLDIHDFLKSKLDKETLEHTERIHASLVDDGFTDIHIQMVALLHDVVEDSDVTVEDIREKYGCEVAKSVKAITRQESETYYEYIRRVREDSVARIVKIYDIIDNLMGRESPPRRGLQKRYRRALVDLGC